MTPGNMMENYASENLRCVNYAIMKIYNSRSLRLIKIKEHLESRRSATLALALWIQHQLLQLFYGRTSMLQLSCFTLRFRKQNNNTIIIIITMVVIIFNYTYSRFTQPNCGEAQLENPSIKLWEAHLENPPIKLWGSPTRESTDQILGRPK